MYDGSTACGEAVLMAHRITRRKKAVLSGGLHPQYRAVTETLAKWGGSTVSALPPDPLGKEDGASAIDGDTSCIVVQYPSVYGSIRDLKPIAEAAHAQGALLVVVVTEVVALGAIKSPGEMGADIVVCEGQSLGNPLGFGGPYVGLFATRAKHVRQMPGRLVGETADTEGRRGWVLTLSTREQHIRREKATSNICTNSGLCALAFTIHLSLLGEAGMTRLARLNHEAAMDAADRLGAIDGVELINRNFFNEFTLRLAKPAAEVVEDWAERGILGGVPYTRFHPGDADLADLLIVAVTETNTAEGIDAFAGALQEILA
jgi:glycine dehydrogenase subunit 1